MSTTSCWVAGQNGSPLITANRQLLALITAVDNPLQPTHQILEFRQQITWYLFEILCRIWDNLSDFLFILTNHDYIHLVTSITLLESNCLFSSSCSFQ